MVSSAVVITATVIIGAMVSIAMASDVIVRRCNGEWVVW